MDAIDGMDSKIANDGNFPTSISGNGAVDMNVPLVAQGDVQPSVQPEKVVRVATKKASKNSVAHSKCATSGTRQLTPTKSPTSKKRKSQRATPKPIVAHEWKFMDSGWALFSRKASISASGKRSSTRKYLRWYTQAAIERLYGSDEN